MCDAITSQFISYYFPGFVSWVNPILEWTFASAGTYYMSQQICCGGVPPNLGDTYTLQISRDMADPIPAVPVPAALWLFGTVLIGLVGFGKRKSRIAA